MDARRWKLLIAGVAALALLWASLPLVVLLAVLGGGSGGRVCAPASSVATATGGGLDQEQLANASVIISVGEGLGVGAQGEVVALAAALTESGLRNLDHGDADSVGLFQMRPSQGWGTVAQILDPVYAAQRFYTALQAVAGWAQMAPGDAAQAVERSAFPGRYAPNVTTAEALVGGAGPAELVAAHCSSTVAAGDAPSIVQAAIGFALAQVGKPYQWGATGPDSFDCSGLTMAAYAAAGVQLSRTTYTQVLEGTAVAEGELLPGDLVFPDPGHVQIYLGNGYVIEAPFTGSQVRVVPMWGFWAARRVVQWTPDQVQRETLALVSAPTVGARPPGFTGNLAGNAQPIHGGLGFYPGDGAEPIELHQFESLPGLYGVRPNTVVLMEDTGSPSRMNGSTWGHFLQAGAWQTANPRPTVVISVPLAFGSFTPDASTSQTRLEEVASGVDDDSYVYLAQALRGAGYPDAVIRLGWEFDGNWMPWEATQHPELYVAAFRHIVLLMRTISSGFVFDWTGAAGQSFNGELAYPGDSYVDIVGMDIYDEPGVNVAAELAPRAAFAAAHGKEVSYAEWGLTSNRGDDPAFIQAMGSWFAGQGSRLAYQSYFLGLAVGSPLTSWPQSRELFARLFG